MKWSNVSGVYKQKADGGWEEMHQSLERSAPYGGLYYSSLQN